MGHLCQDLRIVSLDGTDLLGLQHARMRAPPLCG